MQLVSPIPPKLCAQWANPLSNLKQNTDTDTAISITRCHLAFLPRLLFAAVVSVFSVSRALAESSKNAPASPIPSPFRKSIFLLRPKDIQTARGGQLSQGPPGKLTSIIIITKDKLYMVINFGRKMSSLPHHQHRHHPPQNSFLYLQGMQISHTFNNKIDTETPTAKGPERSEFCKQVL